MKKIIGIFIIMMLIGTSLTVMGSIDEDTSKRCLMNYVDINEFITNFMEDLAIPGLSAGIVKSDEIVWKNAYGYANIEDNIKVENTTLFQLASVSKTITGTALMQLYEQDYFQLDDPINDYLPFEVNHPLFDTDITFKMLVTHTSSIRDNWDYMPNYDGDSPLSLEYYLEEYLTPDGEFYSSSDNFLNREPGTKFYYCNVAVSLAGYLVEVISDTSFDEYCEINIFDPLDMDETAWFIRDLDVNNIAIPYEEDWVPIEHYGYSDYPAGQLRTSTPQLCNFLISIMNNGKFGSNSILNEETIDIILTPYVTDIPLSWADIIGIIWFGLEDDGKFFWGHGGSTPGVRTEIRIYPSDDIGLVVLTNGPGTNNLEPLMNRIFEYGKGITNSPPSNPTCVYDETNDEVILVSVDPDNDKIRYGISWDNNQNVDLWTDYNDSNIEVRINRDNHKGTIGVIAEDEYGGQSVWVSVTSKSRIINKILFERLFTRFPILKLLI